MRHERVTGPVAAVTGVLLAATAAGGGLIGCTDADGGSGDDSPPLVPVDSLVLQEEDSLLVGTASGLAIGRAGNLYVADVVAGRVLRFDARGRLAGTIGRKGDGPGELGYPGALTIAGDSLLIVLDVARRRPYAFSLGDGDFVRAASALGPPSYALSAQAFGDRVWFGFVDAGGGTAAATWSLTMDSVSHLVPLPTEYQGTGLEYAQPGAHVLPWRDTLFVGLMGLADLLVADTSGTVHRRLSVPVRMRRGIPADLAAIYRRDGIGENEISILSLLWAMHRLPSGALALVYLDMTPGSDPQHVNTDAFLTLLTPDGRRACVDIVLPSVETGRPVFAFRGDSLLMLEQRVTSDAKAELFVRVYRLSDAGCPVAM